MKLQDNFSSSSSDSPLQHFSLMPISPSSAAAAAADRGLLLIHLLVNCASHVAARNLEAANALLEHISFLASPDGDAMQRMASCFTDALACRLLKSLPGIYRALQSTRAATPAESLVVRRHFAELCPFLSLASLVANRAIADEMEGEKMVHVVDLHAWDPSQWVALLHILSCRREGPPHLRITGVHHLKHVLDHTAAKLAEEAERLDVPFQFHPVVSSLESLDVESLRVKTGEALAVSSLLQLHRLLSPAAAAAAAADADDDTRKIDSFLRALRGLSPKVVVVAEQESNHNRPGLGERFTEALNYYAALFDCLESTVARGSPERAKVERLLLGEEIRNVLACEGSERKERHERLERWTARMEGGGFARLPLGYDGLQQARLLLRSWRCDGYRVREEGGCFMLCWQSHPLFSLSAWRCCRRFDAS